MLLLQCDQFSLIPLRSVMDILSIKLRLDLCLRCRRSRTLRLKIQTTVIVRMSINMTELAGKVRKWLLSEPLREVFWVPFRHDNPGCLFSNQKWKQILGSWTCIHNDKTRAIPRLDKTPMTSTMRLKGKDRCHRTVHPISPRYIFCSTKSHINTQQGEPLL